jgi:ring-1,2-phenylacetyl-CoA epoxidase subunit PaaD
METELKISREKILKILEDVKDPEIPTISVVDLGIVSDIIVSEDGSVSVTMTPTFAGCPALKVMEELVKQKLNDSGVEIAEVKTTFDKPWNTNMVTPKGREMLKKHGLTPPPVHKGLVEIDLVSHAVCPYCGSTNTILKSPFGPTLCRSLHYCNNCLQAFEQFKPVQ